MSKQVDIKEVKTKKKLTIPHVYTLLMSLIILASIGSYILPAGEFNRVTNEAINRTVVVPGTYHQVVQTPVSFFNTFIAVQKGMIDAGGIIFFIFLAYASWFLVLKTGALHAFIGWLLRTLKGKDKYIIPVFVYVFGLAAAVFGMFEETFGFIPLFVGMGIAMGYDAIVGVGMVALGVGMGYSAAFMNPFTVILAQKFAGLPLLSGMSFRIVLWVIMLGLASWWLMRYAAKVKADPTTSVVYGMDMGELEMDHDELVGTPFSGKSKLICYVVLITIAFLVWGVTQKGWYFNEMAGLFLIMGIICGTIAGFDPNKISRIYVDGFKDIAFGALLIGISRAVLIVLNEGNIVDTIVYYLSLPLSHLPSWISAEGMLIVQNILNFLVPSGSGQAVITMPIFAPLADILGISRQVAVLAFQMGDGLSNLLWPTASIPIICAIAHVPIHKWWKFFVPFYFIALFAQMIAIAAAVFMNLQ